MDAHDGDESYTVSIKGAGIVVEKSVPAHIAREMIVVIMGGAERIDTVSGQSHSRPLNTGARPDQTRDSIGNRISLREFLDECQASSNPSKITAIGEYLLAHDGSELFKREEIRSRFRSAGEAPPANFHRDFGVAVKSGWIAEDPSSPDSFYITKTGRTAIQNKFSAETRKATGQSTGRKRQRRLGGVQISKEDAE